MKVEFWVSSDGDWTNIFIDGTCVFSDHHISAFQFAKLLSDLNNPIDIVTWEEWEYSDERDNPVVYGVRLGEHLV